METVTVHTNPSYPVHIGPGLLDTCGQLLSAAMGHRRCLVAADDTVAALYAPRVLSSLEEAGFRPVLYTFPAGERSKTIATYAALLERMAREKLTRSDFVVALGGGVTGDLAGFAAATYQRGVDFVQMPTTFLAASDASVGARPPWIWRRGKIWRGPSGSRGWSCATRPPLPRCRRTRFWTAWRRR